MELAPRHRLVETAWRQPGANLQTLVAVLIVALIVVVWWRGGISPAQIPFRGSPAEIDRGQLFSALSVMFLVLVGLEAFAHLASSLNIPSVISQVALRG